MPDAGASNRLTFGEVWRAIFYTRDGLVLVVGAACMTISLSTAALVVAAHSAVVGHRSIPLSWGLPALAIFVGFGSILLIKGARGIRRRLRVLGKGLQIWGKVLGIVEDRSGPRIDDQPCRVVKFEYVDRSGRIVVGHSACLSDRTIARLQGRDTIPIVYLADHPEETDLDVEHL